MKRSLLFLVIGIVALAMVVTYAYSQVYLPQSYSQQSTRYYNNQLSFFGYGPSYSGGGMMGGMMGGMYHMMGYYNGYASIYQNQIPVDQAITIMRNPPTYAEIFPSNNSIIFSSQDVNLVVLSMGHGRAVNLTGESPPPYAQHDVFVIYGLINPTVVVPDGATIHVTLINLDAGMYHNLVITPESPPYPYYAMMYIRMNVLGMTPMLPPANYNTGQAYQFSFSTTLSPGIYYYVCEYPGHAQMGMYGEIEVK